jgi:hypothetical protein
LIPLIDDTFIDVSPFITPFGTPGYAQVGNCCASFKIGLRNTGRCVDTLRNVSAPTFRLKKIGAKLRGRLTENTSEYSVKLGKRIEADSKCDFADPILWLGQQDFCLFYPDAGDVVGEGNSGCFVKERAKILSAHVNALRYLRQSQWFLPMIPNVLLSFYNHCREQLSWLHHDSIA